LKIYLLHFAGIPIYYQVKKMRVLGTAGHVDHGKSKLVEALTGIDPDRLKEEKERQMTIDLGFAWMKLPSGEEVGFVDVPGHRDFIENMLAGVGGIDAALFVVASDEGVMPQTREHLAILDLLDVKQGVVALTKIDLVAEEGWLELVRGEVEQLLQSTHLHDAQIVPVSSKTEEGLGQLIAALSDVLEKAPARKDLGRPRLLIDRVFTISGFGTVVTGTLIDGSLHVGQEVEILPSGLKGRIRGLQTHKKKIDKAVPGSRVAANLSGVEVREIHRGDVASLPGLYRPTRLIDVHFRHLADAVHPIKHDQQIKLFLGASQSMARIRLLGRERLNPGEEGWLQLVLKKPVIASRGDHFIVRRPSPGVTLGGGQVANPHPTRHYRRKDDEALKRLESLIAGSPRNVLIQSITGRSPISFNQAMQQAGLNWEETQHAMEELHATDELILLEKKPDGPDSEVLIMDRSTWRGIQSKMTHILENYHELNPLRSGIPREELKSRLQMDTRNFNVILRFAEKEGVIIEDGPRVRSPKHTIRLTDNQQELVDSLRGKFRSAPFGPPSVKQCIQRVGGDLYDYLLENGELIQISPDVVFSTTVYEEMVSTIRQSLEQEGTITVAQVRDLFETSRKYALAMMEHLDAIDVTIREGDTRRLAD
jgi:selenocysteine-specific elongation factor